MTLVKSLSLALPHCFAVVICCLSFTPSNASKIGWDAVVSMDSTDVVAFAAAAEQNARLQFDLNWTFGAMPQRGWYLYVPLIQRLLDTDDAPETNVFAHSLAKWQ